MSAGGVAGAARESSGPDRRPLIGISAYAEQARWGAWDLPAVLIPRSYADRVVAAGGIPVLLPPVPGVQDAIASLDGLVLSGGPDVAPERYGETAGPMTTVVRPDRDAAELALCHAALAARLPVLAICRGMQLMNVALGGTLVQHLPDLVGHDGHCPIPGQMAKHEVRVDPSGRLAALIGDGPAAVPTHHHQGIATLGPGLVGTAWADDGTIEAFELDCGSAATAEPARFVIAVQWHPEAGQDNGLFEALISAASGGSGHGT